jgi:hypothetical protein
MQNTVVNGFVSDWQIDFVLVSDNFQDLLPRLVQAAGLSVSPGLQGI